MAQVHHFAYGVITPMLSFMMSFLGALLALVFTTRSRELRNGRRARWLALAALSMGSTGIWLMHTMAMLGFDVPDSVVRYSLPMMAASFIAAVVVSGLGLLAVGLGEPSALRVLFGGVFTGVGLAAVHFVGIAALRTGGAVSYNHTRIGLTVALSIVAAVVTLWFTVVIEGPAATLGAAVVIAAATCCVHYAAMSSVQVRLTAPGKAIEGLSPALVLIPTFVIAGVMLSTLAYSTVGISIHRDATREEARVTPGRWRWLDVLRRKQGPGTHPPEPTVSLAAWRLDRTAHDLASPSVPARRLDGLPR